MRSTARTISAAGFAALAMLATARAESPDPARGRAVAERSCAKCHAIAPGRTGPEPAIPSFMQMARDPDHTRASLRQMIELPHHEMPAQSLTRAEIDDVVAYILSLKK
ncbi:MAG: cytochrome c [Rhodospirillaceae bacterium]|nr:cytochrome c [Rhodospirillaceae bacterium]